MGKGTLENLLICKGANRDSELKDMRRINYRPLASGTVPEGDIV
jgi:hypothetical protein